MATYTTHQEPAANTTYGSDDIFITCSGSWGGGVYVSWKTKLTLNGSTFANNTATSGGGALGIARTNLYSTDVVYLNNVSNGRGGAININYSSTISGGTFAGNRAATMGGAIYQSKDGYSTLTINNGVLFSGNRASGNGGAIYQIDDGSTTNVTGATFAGNTSGDNGGALYINANASLANVTFDGNVAATSGGAVFVGGTANVSVTDTAFLTRSDTIYVDGGTMSWSGTISLAGDVASTGTINVADGTAIKFLLPTRRAADDVVVDYDALTFAGSASWSVVVDALQDTGIYKLAANGGAISTVTVSSAADPSTTVAITQRDTEYTLGALKVKLIDDADGNLCLDVKAPTFYARTFDGSGDVVATYYTQAISPLPVDTTGVARVEIYEGAILNGSANRAYLGSNTITCTAVGATFSNNVLSNSGGAVGFSNPYFTATDTLFIGNRANGGSSNGGAIHYNVNSNDPGKVNLYGGSFVNNFAQGKGGAINVNGGGYSLQVAGGTWSGVEFINNSAGYGGAVAVYDQGRATDIVIDNARFSGNSASGTGGAIKNNSNVSVSNTVFTGNRANTNGGAINNVGTITISNSSFETVTDTIYNDSSATMNWSGTISLAADVTSTGTINVADGTTIKFLLAPRTTANGAILDYSALTLAGGASWSAVVDTMQGTGSYKLAANGGAISTVTVSTAADPGTTVTINQRDTEYTLGALKLKLVDDADGNLCLDVKSPLYARTFNGNTIVASYTDPAIAPLPIDTTGVNRVEIYDGAILSGSTARAYYGGNAISCTAVGATFSNNALSGAGGAVGGSNLKFSAEDCLFVGNTTTANNGGAIWYNVNSTSVGEVTVSGSTFADNCAYVYGGAIYTVGHYASQVSRLTVTDSVFTGNASVYGGGALFGEQAFAGMTVSGSVFSGNTSTSGGAVESWGFLIASGNTFSANVAETKGGAIRSRGTMTLTGALFSGNTAGDDGGAIYNSGAATISGATFATASDTIYNGGTVTFTGDNVVNASVTGDGTIFVNGADLAFDNAAAITVVELTLVGNANSIAVNGAAVDFGGFVFTSGSLTDFNGLSLADTILTVDASDYVSGDVTIATDVTAIGEYSFTGTVGDAMFLKIDNGDLVMYERTADVYDGMVISGYTGTGASLMTGGVITGAFFGTAAVSGSVRSVITGGTVGNAVIGGAKVTKGNTASIGTVTLDIAGGEIIGGTANGGMLYTAGYAYGLTGGTTTDTNPTLSVDRAVLNLNGGTIAAQNLYSGAHARAGAYTVVDETVITVTDGVYGRIYGGGWAEKYGESVVGNSSITVSGGRVEYIYAGGGNAANGTTRVTGNVDIEVSGNASVDFVFLAGKNINCYVGTDETDTATLTVSGTAKEMIRVSGRNACGAGDKMLGTSVLNVETDLRLGYLDFVEKINIKENNLLTVDTLFHSESASDLTVNFVLDGALDDDWEVIGGNAAYEYIREMTRFEIDGTEYTRAANGALGESGYYLLDDTTNRKFVFSDKSALAQG